MTTDTQDQTNEEKVQAQITRLETILPRLIDTLFDIVEGRKFVAFMSTPAPDGKGFITTVTICDDADAPAPELEAIDPGSSAPPVYIPALRTSTQTRFDATTGKPE